MFTNTETNVPLTDKEIIILHYLLDNIDLSDMNHKYYKSLNNLLTKFSLFISALPLSTSKNIHFKFKSNSQPNQKSPNKNKPKRKSKKRIPALGPDFWIHGG
jgi:hypothetical protein